MERPTCSTCPFWGYIGVIHGGEDRWECHRLPPVLPGVGLARALAAEGHDDDLRRGTWPMTTADDWCGEHPAMPAYLESLRRAPG